MRRPLVASRRVAAARQRDQGIASQDVNARTASQRICISTLQGAVSYSATGIHKSNLDFYQWPLRSKISTAASCRAIPCKHRGALDSVPREHLRGIERVRLVDVITRAAGPRVRQRAQSCPVLSSASG